MPSVSPLQWLMSTQSRGVQPGLGRMHRLLAALGDPQRSLRCLHVAGTNGKGSVCAFAESVLRASGCRTGLYTSPHLVDFSERIRIDGVNAPHADIEAGIRRLQEVTSGWGEGDEPTFFELVTALAFDLLARAACDVVVLETGLGGRLDATNTAPKLACAITPIALDHTEWLGGTLSAIAREKAGIFRLGIPAVVAPQEPEAGEALVAVAEDQGVPLITVREPLAPEVSLGLCGSHQRMNAAVALALIRAAGFDPSPESVAKGLAEVEWPGRFQRLSVRDREVILDGAHNLHATRQLVAAWRQEYGIRRCRLVFGALADKDPAGLLEELLPIAEEVFLVRVDSPRALDPASLESKVLASKIPVHTVHSLSQALEDLFEGEKIASEGPGSPVLLTGSLFLVGEALALFSGGRAVTRTQ